jgi:hypothetical protein
MPRETVGGVGVLVATTEHARAALGGKPEVRIDALPFKVGRESRLSPLQKLRAEIERRLEGAPPLNDLYLLEPPSEAMHISREHFKIERQAGQHVVVDRGSAGGTLVAGKAIGAGSWWVYAEINTGDLIVVGSSQSPYVFRFLVATGPPAAESPGSPR